VFNLDCHGEVASRVVVSFQESVKENRARKKSMAEEFEEKKKNTQQKHTTAFRRSSKRRQNTLAKQECI
jgi:hypothetical protein